MDLSKFYDKNKTIDVYGNPKNKSPVIINCPCGRESVINLNSLKVRLRRNGYNTIILCNYCTRKNKNRLDPEIITHVSVEKTKLLHGTPKNKHSLVVVLCSVCNSYHSIKICSLKFRIWEYKKNGLIYKYVCRKCKSGGSMPVQSDIDSAINQEKTLQQFGSYRDKGKKVIVVCSCCNNEIIIRFDSLKNAIRRHKRKSSESFRYICRSCYEISEKAKHIRLKAVQKVSTDGYRSNIEIATGNILKSLDLKFEQQFAIGYYLFDFFIPDHSVLVEVQGEYWHDTPDGMRRDSSKFSYIDKYFQNFRILYLHERDFFNPEIVKQKISKFVLKDFNEIQHKFDFENVIVRKFNEIDKNRNSKNHVYVDFLNSFHYAQYGRKEKLVVGAFLEKDLIAVCKFTPIIRKEVATSMNLSPSKVIELDRFCIHPNYQKKNFASWFLSRCSKLLFDEFKSIDVIISFADPTFGHTGTIYKASNWKFLKETSVSYFYISPEGYVVHKKTLYEHAQKMKMKEREYAEKFGYEKKPTKSKLKFVLYR